MISYLAGASKLSLERNKKKKHTKTVKSWALSYSMNLKAGTKRRVQNGWVGSGRNV